ncbi:MAG: NAD(P)H-hydrate dehydratase [Granulosicoccus sp.]
MRELLTADEMQVVDAYAARSGGDSYSLMQAAGRAVAVSVQTLPCDTRRVLVLAGSGNNGGDGVIAAEVLRQSGIAVSLLRVRNECVKDYKTPTKTVVTDADRAFAAWQGSTIGLELAAAGLTTAIEQLLDSADVIVDALLGAGLSRDIDGLLQQLIEAVNNASAHVMAVDLPSGLDGNSHVPQSTCVQADSTVTFFRYKPVHCLYPGRALCGRLELAQIGLTASMLSSISSDCRINHPDSWRDLLPLPALDGHKFQRGHVLVRSGPLQQTGAARLSASAALHSGAGLVTLASSTDALMVNASHLTAVMLAIANTDDDWQTVIADSRISALLVGPGNGRNKATRTAVHVALASGKSVVLDADALSCWQKASLPLLAALRSSASSVVLTPHAGEFERLFGDKDFVRLPSKLHQAQAAAAETGAVVVFKGPDTVIAAPDGRTAININAPPWLATAGAGDVLAGIIAAFLSQDVDAYTAACAAVWIHGDAACEQDFPMTAESLIPAVSRTIAALLQPNFPPQLAGLDA